MPRLGRCSGCGFTHYQPFGSRCKIDKKSLVLEAQYSIDVETMACIPGSGFMDRNHPQYVTWLEEQYKDNLAQKQASDDEEDNKVLAKVLERLDKLETTITGGAGDLGAHRQAHPTQAPVPGRTGPSAAEFSALSDSIKHLSLSMDPAKETSKQGMEMRPEFHVQVKVKGANVSAMNPFTLRSEELLFGMLNVFLHLDEKGGDARGYLQHFNFIAGHIMERQFTTLACVKYDRYIVDEVLQGRAKFGSVNPIATGLFLHGGAVVVRDKSRSDRAPFTSQQSRPISDYNRGLPDPRQKNMSRLRDCNRENVPYSMPENWPSEVWFNYNVKGCVGKCLKLHVCSHCNLRHRLSDCKFASRESHDRNPQFQAQQHQFWQ